MTMNFQKLHAQQIKWKPMVGMHFVGSFSMLTIIDKLIVTIFK